MCQKLILINRSRLGGTSNARQLPCLSSCFEVEARIKHTAYKTKVPVEVEILAPRALFENPYAIVS